MTPAAADMIARATLLLAATWTAARYLEHRGASAATRYLVWLSGFGALAILPLCMSFLPVLPLPILPSEPISTAVGPMVAANPSYGLRDKGIGFVEVAEIIYALGAGLLLVRLILGRLLLERLWRRARPLRNEKALAISRCLYAELGMQRRPEICLLSGIIPMTWGSFRPRLLLPDEALGWDSRRLRSVLLHELGHVARQDSLARIWVEAICALYWPHPAIWLAARRLRLAQELASDDLALNHGTQGVEYAGHLLRSAQLTRASLTASAMASSTDLELRLRAILKDAQRSRAGNGFALLVAGLASGLAIAVATIVPAPMTTGAAAAAGRPLISDTDKPASPAPAAISSASATGTKLPRHSLPPRESQARTKAGASEASDLIWVRPEDEDYQAQLSRYGKEVRTYDAALEQYGAQLNSYIRANEEFIGKARTYQERMAEIGPDPPTNIVLPTYPTAPTQPTRPTAPTAPVKPVHPPVLHRPY